MRRRAASEATVTTLVLVAKDSSARRTSAQQVPMTDDLVEADSMTPPNADGLLQMIGQNDEKHDAAHDRLRLDLRALEAQVDAGFQALRASDAALGSDLTRMAATPVDVAKLVLAPRLVASIVITVVMIAGGVWASTAGLRSETAALRSDVRDVLTRMEAQKTASEAVAKVQEVQSIAARASLDDMKRRQELQQYEIQALKEAILTGKVRTR